VINGISSIALPYCTNLVLFLFVRLVDGILCGGRGAGRQQFSSFLPDGLLRLLIGHHLMVLSKTLCILKRPPLCNNNIININNNKQRNLKSCLLQVVVIKPNVIGFFHLKSGIAIMCFIVGSSLL